MYSKDEPETININAVFDLETEKWDKFVLGGLLTVDEDENANEYFCLDWRSEQDFADLLLGLNGDVWAHNGGIFDAKWLLDRAIERKLKCKVIPAGSRIISLEIGNNLRILDSKALTKISLEELTKGQGIEKEKLGLECSCGEACGGYCAISRNMDSRSLSRLKEYLRADCYSLLGALCKTKRWALQNNLDLSYTVGASAWRCAKRWLKLPNADLSKGDHEFARNGYFGGRVQLCAPSATAGYEYDVASMYPSRLAAFPIPVGKSTRAFGQSAKLAWNASVPGIYRATVDVPESFLPPLPVRWKGRVYYPWGNFEGTWTRPELEHAIDYGVKLVKIEECIKWQDQDIVFQDWVESLFKLRSQAPGGKSGPIGTTVKYILNSLTGKFGARPDNDSIDINPDEIRDCKCKQELCLCGAHRPFGVSPNIFIYTKWKLASCSHVEWAAYLTSYARVEWHKQATSVDDGRDVVYGDTDSLFCGKERKTNIGTALGQWEPKGFFTDFVGIAPKVYWYERGNNPIVKGKGLRLGLARDSASQSEKREKATKAKLKLTKAITEGLSDGFDRSGIHGFWLGAKEANFFVKKDSTRHVHRGFGDRFLVGSTTRAPHISEIGYLDSYEETEDDYESTEDTEIAE